MSESNRELQQAQELAIRREYEAHREEFDALGVSISLICESTLRIAAVPYHSVKTRIKSLGSSLEKILRKSYEPTLFSVTDLVGIRVILLYPNHVDATVTLLESEFRVLEKIDKRPQTDPDKFGYSSVHLVCTVDDTRRAPLPEHCRFLRIPFEIQVRTILQEAWAEIEHRIVYKTEVEAPTELKRLIIRLSGSLEIADEQFQEIFDKRQKYVEKLQGSDLGRLRDEPLNIDSLYEVIRKRYPWAEGWEGKDKENAKVALQQLLREMHELGISKVRELMSLIDKWHNEIKGESERGYLLAIGKMLAETDDDKTFALGGLGDGDWHARTGQYFTPVGHLRRTLKSEFPDYDVQSKNSGSGGQGVLGQS